jgi:hypothetical protein
VPIIIDLKEDLERYIRKHGLSKKWERVERTLGAKTTQENIALHLNF